MATNTRTRRSSDASEAMTAVVAGLIELIETGSVGTWSMPWERIGAELWEPTNAATDRPYTGGNRVVLALTSMLTGYQAAEWGTYRQWASIGGQVRRGETSTRIIRPIELTRDSNSEDQSGEESNEQRPRIVWRTIPVFNADQVDGTTRAATPESDPRPPIERAETLTTAWRAAAMTITETGDRAFYDPRADRIQVPARGQFPILEHWYSTVFHEATHWTGPRLERDLTGRFGDDTYAAEELIAELGAAMLTGHTGIAAAARNDHAAYVAGWLRILRADPRHLWTAAGAAQTATDHLLELAATTTAAA